MFILRRKRVFAAAIVIVMIISLFALSACGNGGKSESSASDVPFVPTYKSGSFGEFLQLKARESRPNVEVDLGINSPLAFYVPEDYTEQDEQFDFNYSVGGRTGVVYTPSEGWVEYVVNVPSAGLYCIGVNYYAIQDKSAAVERTIYVNGELQFNEARSSTLDRIYKDNVEDVLDYESFFSEDAKGNQTRREQVELFRWNDGAYIKDASASYTTPLQFYFEKGENVIRIESVREPCAFSRIWLYGYQELEDYEVFLMKNEFNRNDGSNEIDKIQAETPQAKNDPTLFASYDRASAATEPASITTIKLNTIGGNASGDPSWRTSGQWIEYVVDVPVEGLYKIVMRARQSTMNGSFVSRKILINGELQFAEAQNVAIGYSSDWQMLTPKDEGGNELMFLFKQGQNTIRFECGYGQMGDVINAVDAIIARLNDDYAKILMITGSSPDIYRDYEFDEELPDVVADFKTQADILRDVHDELVNVLGSEGQYTSILRTVYNHLYSLNENPDSIAKDFAVFKNNITNLGTWLSDIRSQPLEIDYIIVAEENYKAPAAEAGFFQGLWFQTKMFFSSFFTDFNSISAAGGNTYSENCKVWILSARDQAQVLRQIIDRSFIDEYQINLSLDLVPGGSVLPSILANKGPDIILGQTTETVVNYATRGALEPLEGYAGFDKVVSERFIDNSTLGMSVVVEEEGKKVTHVYGLPETMTFGVLFYRTDILEDIGKNVPESWDEVYSLIPVLQKHSMDFAPPDYQTILYQNGGYLYRDQDTNGQFTDIDSEIGIQSFITFTDFYTSYGIPIAYDFPNRFRLGEMPVGVNDLYAFYNKMAVFAPEIKGLWTFSAIPGTEKEDGEVDRSTLAAFTASCMLSGAKNKDNAWKFLDWWTSDEVQTTFGREIESVLGAAGRYNSANVSAVLNMSWTAAETKAIAEQIKYLVPTPEHVGGYYLTRYLGFSKNSVVVDYEEPRTVILDNSKFINDELENKRKELGLPLDSIAD